MSLLAPRFGFGIDLGKGYGAPSQGGGVASKLPVLKAAIAAIKAGTPGARARWAMVGTSLVTGWGSNGAPNSASGASGLSGTAPNVLRAKALPAKLSALFNAAGVPTRADAVWGTNQLVGTQPAAYAAYNPKIAFSGAWSTTGATVGSQFFTLAISATGTITITPEVAADKIDLFFPTFTNSGGLTVSDSSGVIGNVDTRRAATGYSSATVSRAVASLDPFIITRWAGATNATGVIYLGGWAPWDSQSPRLEIWNMGWGGSRTIDWRDAAQPYSPLPVLGNLAYEAVSVDLGTNDAAAGYAAAGVKDALNTILLGLPPASDRMLIATHPANPTSNAQNMPEGYRTAMSELASAYGLVSPPDFSNAGLLPASDYFDAIHLVETGYAKEAQYLFAILQNQLGI